MHPVRLLSIAAVAALAPVLCAQDPVLQFNEAALDAIRAESTAPPVAARRLAMLHVAIFDACNGIRPRYDHYLVAPAAPANADRTAAIATAAHDVLAALQPSQSAAFAALRDGLLGALPANPRRTNGIAWGATVARQVLAARSNDGANAPQPAFPGENTPGVWRPTISFGGVVRPALLPGWGDVTPFGIASVAALQPPAPPALASVQYALEVALTREVGGTASALRSADQTEIALFWGYGPGSATPPGHWNEIAQNVAERRRLDVFETARLFALLNIAEADAAIACWRCKYDIALWRPITAIQLDGDGNPLTNADPTWTPLLPTPPFPEYTSGHSTFSGAAAVVLARFFGSDRIPFVAGSDDLPGVRRSYRSFSHAAWESGMSRIYGGIHWMSGNVQGLAIGARIGNEVCDNLLRRR